MNENPDSSNGAAFFCGLLTGFTFGAGLAILLAPKPGPEMRRDLASGASDVAQAAKDTWSDLSTTATAAAQKGREAYAQTRKAAQDVADSASKSLDGVKAAAKDAANAVAAASGSFPRPAGDGHRH